MRLGNLPTPPWEIYQPYLGNLPTATGEIFPLARRGRGINYPGTRRKEGRPGRFPPRGCRPPAWDSGRAGDIHLARRWQLKPANIQPRSRLSARPASEAILFAPMPRVMHPVTCPCVDAATPAHAHAPSLGMRGARALCNWLPLRVVGRVFGPARLFLYRRSRRGALEHTWCAAFLVSQEWGIPWPLCQI